MAGPLWKKKINCFNIKIEVTIIYGTYEPILIPLMHILQKLWFTWNKTNCFCHIQISCQNTNYITWASIVDCIHCHMLFTVRDKGYATWTKCCTMKWESCGVHGIQCTIDWRKLYEVYMTRTIASTFYRYPDVLVRNGRTSLEKRRYITLILRGNS